MKKLLKIFTIALGTLVLAIGTVFAADVTDTVDVGITGTPKCEISISSSDMTVTAPTEVGEQWEAFVNAPVAIELLDNDAGLPNLKVKISSSLPDQYGTDETYYIHAFAPIMSPVADSDFTAGVLSKDIAIGALTTSDQYVFLSNSDAGDIFHFTLTHQMALVVNTDKRVRGDTSDGFTIQYTFVDTSD